MKFLSDESYAALIMAAQELNKDKATHRQAYGMYVVLKELQSTQDIDYRDGDADVDLPPGVN